MSQESAGGMQADSHADDDVISPLEGIDDSVIARFALDRLPFAQPVTSPAALLDLTGSRVLVTGGGEATWGRRACTGSPPWERRSPSWTRHRIRLSRSGGRERALGRRG